LERFREQPGLGVVLMPYYFRRTDGSQVYASFTELGEVLSYRVDAHLMRGPDTTTWVAVGDGLPMPVEANISRFYTASTAPEVLSALSSLRVELGVNSDGVVGVGYESPLGASGTLEWERPVLAVRALEVREGGARYVVVRMRFVVGGQIIRLSRWSTGSDEIVDDTGAHIVFAEEA